MTSTALQNEVIRAGVWNGVSLWKPFIYMFLCLRVLGVWVQESVCVHICSWAWKYVYIFFLFHFFNIHFFFYFFFFGCCFFFFFFFFGLLRAAPTVYGEVPRLGVELESQPLAYTTAIATPDLSLIHKLCRGLHQCWIFNPLSKAWDQTRNLMVPSWIRFCCARMGIPHFFLFLRISFLVSAS